MVLQQQISSRHLLLLLLLLLLLSGQLGTQPACYSSAARAAAQRGRTQFAVLHEEKAGRFMREHKNSSEAFFAPASGTLTAAGDLKPRWVKDDTECEDY